MIINLDIHDGKTEWPQDYSRHKFKIETYQAPGHTSNDPDEKERMFYEVESIEYYSTLLEKYVNLDHMEKYFKKSSVISDIRETISQWVDEVYNCHGIM